MNKKSFTGIALIIFSTLIALSGTRFTGAVIGSSNLNYLSLASIALFATGIFFLTTATLEKKITHFNKKDELYYKRRANELTKVMGANRDSWISFYEANGILNELAKKGYDIEHGKNMLAYPLSGKPLHVSIQEPHKGKRKHLFITKDPQDSRLNYVDIKDKEGIKSTRTPSSYHPKHARQSGKETMDYLSKISIEGKG